MTGNTEDKPATVPEMAKQAGDIRGRWSWVEPSVWTERMLTALETGVKGGKWFSLMDKVYSEANLRSAFERVKRNGGSAGVDHQSIKRFEKHLEVNLGELHEKLKGGEYHPQSVRRVWIPKPGRSERRPLGIPTVMDRVVQTAVRNVIEPIFEREFAERSYGFRPGRGCRDALSRVWRLLRSGHTYVVDADLKGYFDSIPHEALMKKVCEKVSDGRVIELLRAYLKQKVLDGAKEWTPEGGTPQGAVISPLLANIYLDPLDHMMVESGWEIVRYADDLVILCRSMEDAEEALERVRKWVKDAGLTLHPTKTRIVDATQKGGFEFLGYHFERGYIWPREKSIKKLRDAIRSKTPRNSGRSLQAIVADVNRTLVGWHGYFRASHGSTYRRVDGWVRMRLRSIMRQRHKGRGRGKGLDHIRWPNAYFAGQGLYSLVTANGTVRQP
jgi:RNA-directed DNA polymerase